MNYNHNAQLWLIAIIIDPNPDKRPTSSLDVGLGETYL